MTWFMKEPCAQCPFRRDVRPFLHPSRGRDLAYSTENRFNGFCCHKTLDYDDDDEEGGMAVTSKSLMCAGFLSMQVGNCIDDIPGFKRSDLVYSEPNEMAEAYQMAADGEWEL